MGKKRGLRDSYRNKNDLIEDIMRQWESIEDNYILALYESMGERLKAVITTRRPHQILIVFSI